MRSALARGLAALAALTTAAAPGRAQVIVAPVAATVEAGGPGMGSLGDTFNQAGLLAGYTSGVTLFDAYLAANPLHTFQFTGAEWFSSQGTSSATVTYDLGAVMSVSKLALWNEESSGIGALDLLGSTDGALFTPLALGLAPTDHPGGDYGADVFTWAARDVRYVRLVMSGCPQPDPGLADACAIGEVAFAAAPGASAVPEPGTVVLAGTGLAALALGARRRRRG